MIERIRTYHLKHKLTESFGFSQWHYDSRHALLVEVVSRTGEIGWGECYGPPAVTQAAIEDIYAPLLIGEDPMKNGALWDLMWRASLDFARKGPMMGAISGLDMALMDLKGKLLGVSVSDLMGGAVRDEVTSYATGMYFREVPETKLMDIILDEASDYVNQGFNALKIKVGKNMAFDQQLAQAMRKTFPDCTLMADSNHAYDLPEAIKIGKLLSDLDYAWFEEPLSPEMYDAARQLSDKVDVPIAAGECEQTRWGFQQLLSTGGIQIAQPDLGYCGGPSEALKIRAIASSHGINVVPHAWGTMVNLACATHFLASSYIEPGRADISEPMLEFDRTENLLRDKIFTVGLERDGNIVTVPKTPGLGVEPDRSALEEFCV